LSQLHPNAGSQLHAEILLLPSTLLNFHEDALVDDHRANGANHGADEFDGVQIDEITEETVGQETSSSAAPQQTNNEADLAMEPVAADDQGESTWSSAHVQQTESIKSVPDPVPRQTVSATKSRADPSSPDTCSVQVQCDTPRAGLLLDPVQKGDPMANMCQPKQQGTLTSPMQGWLI
jgi:hypothetical protein